MSEQDTSDISGEGNFMLPEDIPSGAISPESIRDLLLLQEDAVKEDPDFNWETYDKSIKAWSVSAQRAGDIVFGYVDGNGKFIAADSSEDAHKIFEETGDLLRLSYNPRPVTIKVKVKGYRRGGLIVEPDENIEPPPT